MGCFKKNDGNKYFFLKSCIDINCLTYQKVQRGIKVFERYIEQQELVFCYFQNIQRFHTFWTICVPIFKLELDSYIYTEKEHSKVISFHNIIKVMISQCIEKSLQLRAKSCWV